jgi:hypothetical protein
MTLREFRESRGLRIEDMAQQLGVPIHELCMMEMAATHYHNLLGRFIPCEVVPIPIPFDS